MGGESLGMISIWLDTGLKEEAGVSPREMDSFPGWMVVLLIGNQISSPRKGGGRYLLVFCVVFHKAYVKVNRRPFWGSLVRSLASTRR